MPIQATLKAARLIESVMAAAIPGTPYLIIDKSPLGAASFVETMDFSGDITFNLAF